MFVGCLTKHGFSVRTIFGRGALPTVPGLLMFRKGSCFTESYVSSKYLMKVDFFNRIERI